MVSLVLGKVAVELGVELVPDFLGEAKLAQLGEDSPQEVLLVYGQVVLCDLEQHWLRLTEVAPSCLTEEKC